MNMITRIIDRVNTRWLNRQDGEEGQALVEYSLLFVLIIIVCFSILTTLSGTVNEKLFQVISVLP